MVAQIMVLINTDSRKTKDIIIGKNKEWRDNTHRKTAVAFALADCVLLLPLILTGSIAVLYNQVWGYGLWCAAGIVSVYFSILFWILEKEYTYPVYGPVVYFTYYWGFFLYWGIGVTVFSMIKLLLVFDKTVLQ